MWVEIKKAQSLMMAEMWKELFEGEGIPTHILPTSGKPIEQESTIYRILMAKDKEGVVSEVLRKL